MEDYYYEENFIIENLFIIIWNAARQIFLIKNCLLFFKFEYYLMNLKVIIKFAIIKHALDLNILSPYHFCLKFKTVVKIDFNSWTKMTFKV